MSTVHRSPGYDAPAVPPTGSEFDTLRRAQLRRLGTDLEDLADIARELCVRADDPPRDLGGKRRGDRWRGP